MSRCRGLLLPVLFLAGCVLACVAQAAPWDKLLTTKRVDADPNKPYALNDKNGPWMIMAASFSNDKAREKAHDLVVELRKRYKMPAYVYEKKFELGKETSGIGYDKYGRPKRMKYQAGSEIQEVAVMVGNYGAVNDPEAEETLRKVKYIQPECLKPAKPGENDNYFQGFRSYLQRCVVGEDAKRRGPMATAFVTTNPLLPPDYYVPKGLDKLLVKSNDGVEHSLLKCPGRYTVQIAHFKGASVIDQKVVHAINTGQESMVKESDKDADGDTPLVAAAKKAHKLTEELRSQGVEAYEFHDYSASIVTVGSFDSAGSKRPDGGYELNPAVVRVIDTYKGETRMVPNRTEPATVAKTIYCKGRERGSRSERVGLDIQPIVVQVPKRSIGADYVRDAAAELR